MLNLTITVCAVALAGTASAAGWRSLRVDASSEAAFEQSLAVFKDKLSNGRRYVFGESLKDIWVAGAEAAAAEEREYMPADYYRQLHGLSYEEVVKLIDPTGETARRYRAAYNPHAAGDRASRRYAATQPQIGFPNPIQRPFGSLDGENMRGRPGLTGPSLPQ